MGRYVSGNWEWKFAFGDQSSSFGEVLEKICDKGESNYCTRYTSDNGEIVKLYIKDVKTFKEHCKKFVRGVKKLTRDQEKEWSQSKLHLGDEYWDRLMIKKFMKDFLVDVKENEEYEFFVEY